MDLNGNVTLLVSTTTGQATATYDYGPFGEPLRESGEHAKLNPYRFSTKYSDDETGLLDYGLRYYRSLDGRWPSRDPIEEEGGKNLYGMVKNDLLNHTDYLGQYEIDFHYYTIYYLFRARCYTPEESNKAAWASQYVDDNPDTEPLKRWPAKRAKYHFHGSGPNKPTKRNPPALVTEIKSLILADNLYLAGVRLHTYADTWSHEDFTAWWNKTINKRTGNGVRSYYGHADAAEGGHAPDKPYNDINKSLEASFAIYSLIPSKGELISPSIIREDLIRGFSDRNPAGSVRSGIHKANIKIRFGDEAAYNLNK
jgi:RHS repeat-associated protein